MAINKVELCGVNTSRLPVLNAEEKETFAPVHIIVFLCCGKGHLPAVSFKMAKVTRSSRKAFFKHALA